MNLPASDKIEQAYEKLSSEEFEAMTAVTIDKKCTEIGNMMRFNKEQIDALSLYTTFTILGLYSQKDLYDGIESEGISQLQLTEAYSQVIDSIITPYLEKVQELKATDEGPEAIEQTNSEIEVIDSPKTIDEIESDPYLEKVIDEDEEEQQAEAKQTEKEFAKSEIKLEDAKPNLADYSPYQKESRDALLAGLEHPPEGKISFYATPKVQPKSVQSMTSAVPIFKTSATVPTPAPVPANQISQTQFPKNPEPVQEISGKQPDAISAPNKIPITVSAPADLPVEELTHVIPIQAMVVPQDLPKKQIAEGDAEVILKVKSENAGFVRVPKALKAMNVFTIDTMKKETVASETDPLENPVMKRDMDAKLREAAQSRQHAFVAQKMVSPFSIPRRESVVSAVPETTAAPSLASTLTSKDPYREMPR